MFVRFCLAWTSSDASSRALDQQEHNLWNSRPNTFVNWSLNVSTDIIRKLGFDHERGGWLTCLSISLASCVDLQRQATQSPETDAGRRLLARSHYHYCQHLPLRRASHVYRL